MLYMYLFTCVSDSSGNPTARNERGVGTNSTLSLFVRYAHILFVILFYLIFSSFVPKNPFTGATERIVTVYDTPDNTISYPEGRKQEFLRNRVSQAIAYNKNGEISKTWYSYDAHGNVKWLAQKTDNLPVNYIGYEYDLISNKVTKVKYNENFFHRYSYDEDNRLQRVEASVGGIIWDNDATYNYYAHGPLKRTLIGEDGIQAIDYTYTINGWLKAINAPNVAPKEDLFTEDFYKGMVAAEMKLLMS